MNITKTLELHKKWINNEYGGKAAVLRGADMHGENMHCANMRYANLRGADLSDANLRGADMRGANLDSADLRGADMHDVDLRDADMNDADLCGANLDRADLRGADMRNADLDGSCWSLCCGSLGVHIDDRLAIQFLYHLIYNVDYSKHISQEIKNVLLTDEIIELANRFHRVDETDKIEKTMIKKINNKE